MAAVAIALSVMCLWGEGARAGAPPAQPSEVSEDAPAAPRALFTRDSDPLWRVTRGDETADRVRGAVGARATRRGHEIATYLASAPGRAVGQALLALVAAWAFIGSRRLPEERRPSRVHVSWRTLVERPASSAIVLGLGVGTILHAQAPLAFLDLLVAVAIAPLARVARALMPGVALRPMYLLFGVYAACRTVDLLAGSGVIHRWGLVAAHGVAVVAMGWAGRDVARRAALSGAPSEGAVRWLLGGAVTALAAALVANILGFVALASTIVDGSLHSLYVAAILGTSVSLLDGGVRFLARLPAAQGLGVIRNHGDYVEDRAGRLLMVAGALIWVAYMLHVASLAGPLLVWVKQTLAVELTVGTIRVALGDVCAFLASIWLATTASRGIRFALEEDVLPRMLLPKGVPATVSTLTHYAVLGAGIFVALAASGVHLDQFAFAAGALGIGIGFGLQGIVNDLVSGLILLFERPIQVGDIIELASLTGRVQHIGMRSSRVRTLDGAEVIVPNSSLITDPVINWTHSDQVRRFEVVVGVAYGSRPEQVIPLLHAAASGTPGVLDHPEPVTLMQAFGDSSVDFVVRAWAPYDDHLAVRSAVHVRIEAALRDANIVIPFPQRDVHLHPQQEAPAL